MHRQLRSKTLSKNPSHLERLAAVPFGGKTRDVRGEPATAGNAAKFNPGCSSQEFTDLFGKLLEVT